MNDFIYQYYIRSNSEARKLIEEFFAEIDEYDNKCQANVLVDVGDIHERIPEMA